MMSDVKMAGRSGGFRGFGLSGDSSFSTTVTQTIQRMFSSHECLCSSRLIRPDIFPSCLKPDALKTGNIRGLDRLKNLKILTHDASFLQENEALHRLNMTSD